jgi:hypothetical protein
MFETCLFTLYWMRFSHSHAVGGGGFQMPPHVGNPCNGCFLQRRLRQAKICISVSPVSQLAESVLGEMIGRGASKEVCMGVCRARNVAVLQVPGHLLECICVHTFVLTCTHTFVVFVCVCVQVAGGCGSLVLSPDTSDEMMRRRTAGAEVCMCVYTCVCGGVGEWVYKCSDCVCIWCISVFVCVCVCELAGEL